MIRSFSQSNRKKRQTGISSIITRRESVTWKVQLDESRIPWLEAFDVLVYLYLLWSTELARNLNSEPSSNQLTV